MRTRGPTSIKTMANFFMVGVFFLLITVFIWYFNRGESHYQTVALSNAADKFSTIVIAAHWQWRAQGEPNRIMLVDYNSDMEETNRRPVTMGDLGWPRVEPNAMGCQRIWQAILDIPLQLNNFNVKAEFIDGLETTGKILDTKCRYSIAFGSHFDYSVFTGQVVKAEVIN